MTPHNAIGRRPASLRCHSAATCIRQLLRPASRVRAARGALLCLALWPWLLLLGLADAAAEPVRLRLSFQLPLTSTLGANLVQLKEAAARDPDNAVAIEILHGAKALPDRTVAKSVMAGEIEMATANVVTLADKVRGVDILSLPFLFNSHALLKAMLDPSRRSRRLLDEAILMRTGARVLMWQPYGTNVFFSKGVPASKPTDIAGRRIRASGGVDVEFGRACGAEPEIIAAGAQHEAMKTGRIEMAMTSAENVSARKFWEISDTLTRTNHSPVMLLLLVNERAWQSLSPEQRAAMGRAAADAERELWEGLIRADEEADAFARSKGMTVAELSSFDLAEWRACSAPVVDGFMAEAGHLGQELLKQYGQMRADPCCQDAHGSGGGYRPF
jgi:C4-dicarboxylate-binding protein DctP